MSDNCPIRDEASWFIVLPDCAASQRIADAVHPDATQLIAHPSGRPWIMGQWPPASVATATAGQARAVVAGQHSATTALLAPHVTNLRDVRSLDPIPGRLPGSHIFAAVADGTFRVQGSVSGLRRVFFARMAGVTVAASRAEILARLTGARLDELRLGLHLLYLKTPNSLNLECLWHGIRAVPPDCYLLVGPQGRDRLVRWWRPPEPVLPTASGAPAFRDALATAVDVRTRDGGTVSCDLSGGLDSTPLCFLAARGRSRLMSVTVRGLDPAHDDALWADRASAELDGVERLVLNPADLPHRYADMGRFGTGLDEPTETARDHAYFAQIGLLLRARGSRMHLVGHGGDQILSLSPAYLHAVLRARPLVALSHLRGYRAQCRWPLGASLGGLTSRRSYGSWLSASAAELTAPPPLPQRRPLLDWGGTIRLPPWVTPQAADELRSALRRSAATAEPLAPTRAQHAALEHVRHNAQSVGSLALLMNRAGLELAAPYLDDRVIEAALVVRMHEHTTPWRYKPLMVTAMAGVVPGPVLSRTTKAEFTAEVNAGLRQHRREIAALLEEPVLAQLGLIDADAVRGALAGSYPTVPPQALLRTLACEVWVRAHRQAAGAWTEAKR